MIVNTREVHVLGVCLNELTPWVQFKANLINDELEVNLTHDGVQFIVYVAHDDVRFKVNCIAFGCHSR